MDRLDPPLRITAEEWRAKQARGLVAMIDDNRYIVSLRARSNEPVYQRVWIRTENANAVEERGSLARAR